MCEMYRHLCMILKFALMARKLSILISNRDAERRYATKNIKIDVLLVLKRISTDQHIFIK